MTTRDLIKSAFGPNFNLYSTVLNLSTKTPSSAQIRKAYHKRALEFHPDKQRNKSEAELEVAKLKFQVVSLTYEILSKEDSRKVYDETGEIYDDEDVNLSKEGVEQWKKLFSKMFGKVTTDEIDNFEQSYKMSEEERLDVLKYYKICKGNFNKMLTCVMLSEEEDVPRWKNDFIEPAIEKGEIERLHQDTDNSHGNDEDDMEEGHSDEDTVTESEESDEDNQTKIKPKPKIKSKPKPKEPPKSKAKPKAKPKVKAKKTKMSKKEKEAKEAEDLMTKMRQNALARRGNASSFGSLMSSLESRYAPDSNKKRKKKHKDLDMDPPDIPQEEFDRIQAGFKNSKKSNSRKR